MSMPITLIVIQKSQVDQFQEEAKKKETKSLEEFLNSCNENTKYTFETPELYKKFLQLIKDSNFSSDKIYPRTLGIFRKSLGLPQDLFKDGDVKLISRKSNKEVAVCSSELLKTNPLFERMLTSASAMKEARDKKVELDLSEEAILACKSYLYKGNIGNVSLDALHELNNFARMSLDSNLSDLVSEASILYFLDNKNIDAFDAELLGKKSKKFVELYLKKQEIPFEILESETFRVPLFYFFELFTVSLRSILEVDKPLEYKESKLKDLLARMIDQVSIDKGEFYLIEHIALISAKYRDAIIGIHTNTVKPVFANLKEKFEEVGLTFKISQEEYENFSKLFPNADFSKDTEVKFLDAKLNPISIQEKSKTELEQIIKSNQADSFVYQRLAQLLIVDKEYAQAEIVLSQALARFPENSRFHAYYALVLFKQQKNYEEAESHLRTAIEINPKHVSAYIYLGLVLQKLGSPIEAKECFQMAMELNPRKFTYYLELGIKTLNSSPQGNLQEAEEALRIAINLNPEHYDAYVDLGITLIDQGKSIEAEPYLRKAVDNLKQNSRAHNMLGSALIELGKYEEAEKSLMVALKLNPEEPLKQKIFRRLGRALLEQKKFEEADKYLKKALEMNPTDLVTLRTYGRLYTYMGKYDEALKAFTQSIRNGGDKDAVTNLWMAEFFLRNKEYFSAKLYINNALKIDSNNTEAIALLKQINSSIENLSDPEKFEIYLKLYRHYSWPAPAPEAKEALLSAIKVNREFYEGYKILSLILIQEENYKEAEPLLQVLAIQFPLASEHQHMLGMVLNELGNFAEAENCLRKAIALGDSHNAGIIYRRLARSLLEQKKLDEAMACLYIALEKNPNDIIAYRSFGRIYTFKEEYQKAEEAFNKVLLSFHDDLTYAWRGELYMLQQKYALAISDAKRALSINPRNTFAAELLAKLERIES